MKKILSLLLCAVIAFCFAGCGKGKDKLSEDTVDINYYVSHGKMPESKYDVGSDVDEMLAGFEADEKAAGELYEETGEEYYFDTYESGDYTAVTDGNIAYYYLSEQPDKGIRYVVNFGTSYSFEPGTSASQVKQVLDNLKLEYTEDELSDEESFFVPGALEITGIKYKTDKNMLLFVFSNDALCACALYSN